ncbi:MAG: NAD(+)/NADH kinase [Clostridiales bacterium]|nr:NAD(+)/NADH kinase [Clostridiales bacterium]
MRLGIIANLEKDPHYSFARYAAAKIVSMGSQAVIDDYYLNTELSGDPNTIMDKYDDCDLIFCLGGDGTFLSAVHDHFLKDVPIIGVNLGSIGFLAEIQPEMFDDYLDRILKNDYRIEKRLQLEATVLSENGKEKGSGICLNDAVIARGNLLHVLTLDLFIDDDYVERVSGDGVIISTPTGSTAYSLAAGGPIIKPDLHAFLVTPICPHTLHSRSYVVSEDSRVEIHIKRFTDTPILCFDGRSEIVMEPMDRVIIEKSIHPMKIAIVGHSNYYQTIRKKIRARGSFYENGEK